MTKKKDMIKAELIQAIEKKVSRANPLTRRILLRGLGYRKKSELKRILKKARVTREGDIDLR